MKNWRVNIIFIFVLLAFGLVLVRLVSIQIVQGSFYSALAQGQQNYFQEITGERGEIFIQNKNGNIFPLAVNHSWYFIYISPKEIENKEETSNILSNILSIDKEIILKKINKTNSYEELKEKLTEKEINEIENLKIKGIYISSKKGRFYPNNSFASKIIGFVDKNGEGKYGLEGKYEELLSGEKGLIKGNRTRQGILLNEDKNSIDKGSNLLLTIDYNIQSEAEKILQESIEEFNAGNGQIIVMDPRTGRILALADYPNFNPNEYGQYSDNLEIFINSATQKLFEPGSIFKALTMAIAINEGKVTPETTYIDEGFVKAKGITIYNYGKRVHGEQTMANVLEKSINTGIVYAMREIGNEVFLNYIEKFGIFRNTNIDLPETFSINKELKKGYEINYVTASFGQGIELTPIQIIKAFSAIVNDGKMVTPFIIEKTFKNFVLEETEIIQTPVISKETAETMTKMLVNVIESSYSRKAKIDGYWVGGKTGTAQISNSALEIDSPGYSDTATYQSFIGFAPAYNPEFLILVKLFNPETKSAESSAAPTFKKIAKYIIDYYQIPPDYTD